MADENTPRTSPITIEAADVVREADMLVERVDLVSPNDTGGLAGYVEVRASNNSRYGEVPTDWKSLRFRCHQLEAPKVGDELFLVLARHPKQSPAE